MDWQRTAYILIGLLIGVVFHEYMHGRIADAMGDHTARAAGRLTLNPVAHIDPIGTVIMPIALLLISGGRFTFGYAKPVPVNPFLFKKPRKGMMLVALSGPLTNFTIAVVVTAIGLIVRLSFGLQFVIGQGGSLTSLGGSSAWADLAMLFYFVAVINILLGFFNLIPVPPLDGSHVLEYFLPPRALEVYQSFSRYGFILVFIVVFLLGDVIFGPITPVFNLVSKAVFGPIYAI